MPLRIFLASLSLLCLTARASFQGTDATDMWFIPAESGWGLNVIQQENLIFATLFVYAPGGQAHWYVAPNMQLTFNGAFTYTGPLYETTGPQPTGFDPNAVTKRQVGTMSLVVEDFASGTLTYTVDGFQVVKHVQRFGFGPMALGGKYQGAVFGPAGSCFGGADSLSIRIFHDGGQGSSFMMETQGATSGDCIHQGTSTQQGRMLTVTGTYSCSPSGRSGSFTLENAQANDDGFTAQMSGGVLGCSNGRIAGVSTAF